MHSKTFNEWPLIYGIKIVIEAHGQRHAHKSMEKLITTKRRKSGIFPHDRPESNRVLYRFLLRCYTGVRQRI